MTSPPDAVGQVFLFGPFRLTPTRQTLLDGERRVRVGSRALEILTVLVERHGELVSKQELMARAWPKTVVEENNLKVQIAALRKALGEDSQDQRYLATVIGHGYRFVAPVEYGSLASAGVSPDRQTQATHNIPATLVRPIGRSATLDALSVQLSRARLVTVTGPGGIGKTTVALALAQRMVGAHERDVWFVDLSTLADASFVPQAIATAAGLAVHSHDVATALANYFAFCNRPQLVVLDSCEHVIEAAAAIAEHLVSTTSNVSVLATSREPLRATGEHVFRLEPLVCPIESASLTADEALQYPAVQLFMERAAASRTGFGLRDDDAAVVAEICRRLDGIALAIELAATRLDAFGVHELLTLLGERSHRLGQGRRAGPQRHRTLAATLDWSHQLLPEVERIVLRRLAVFAGGFLLTSATAVSASGDVPASAVIDAIAGLVAKSMVSADVRGERVRYRLLDTTRDYARQKLADAGELNTVLRRHAEHFQALYAQAENQWSAASDESWLETRLSAIDDLRAALNWAFAAHGDASLGIALTVSAIPAWLHLSSLEECRRRVEYALSEAGDDVLIPDDQKMKLHAAFAASAMYTRGMVPEVDIAWASALEIAEKLGDKEYQLRSLLGACCSLVYAGKHRVADELLRKFCSVAASSGNAAALSDGERLNSLALHFIGEQATARAYLERVLSRQVGQRQRPQLSRFHVGWRVAAQSIMSNILWTQGLPDQALRLAQEATDDAQAKDNALTLGYVLMLASVPIALHVGDLVAAEAKLDMLQKHLARHGLVIFAAPARCLQGALLIRRHDPAGLPTMIDGLEQMQREHFGMGYPMYAGIYAQGLCFAGHHALARAAIDDALAWSKVHDELWCRPELLRIKGEILASIDLPEHRETIEHLYEQAIEMARQQGALSWELRATTSLARLGHRLGKTEQASARLLSVYRRFTEGFETPDLEAAQALLDCFRDAHA